MGRTIEVEMKFEVRDSAATDRFVSKLKKLGQKRIVDLYLDTPEGLLFQRGIFMRVRNEQQLDIKYNLEDMGKALDDVIEHTHCDEVSAPLPLDRAGLVRINQALRQLGMREADTPDLNDLMTKNSLVHSFVLDKKRTSYEAGDFRIDIDQVTDLGEYLEIERMTDETADTAQITRGMKSYLSHLALDYVDVGYNELYWRKHNFALYLKGKYLLIQDRTKYRPKSLPAA